MTFDYDGFIHETACRRFPVLSAFWRKACIVLYYASMVGLTGSIILGAVYVSKSDTPIMWPLLTVITFYLVTLFLSTRKNNNKVQNNRHEDFTKQAKLYFSTCRRILYPFEKEDIERGHHTFLLEAIETLSTKELEKLEKNMRSCAEILGILNLPTEAARALHQSCIRPAVICRSTENLRSITGYLALLSTETGLTHTLVHALESAPAPSVSITKGNESSQPE